MSSPIHIFVPNQTRMESIKLVLLKNLGDVYEQSKNCKLEPICFEEVDLELNQLSEYFDVSKTQSFFIAMVFALNYKGDTVDLNDLVKYFDCNPMKILEYSDDFEILYKKGIFSKQKSRHRMDLALANDQFTINEKITKAILQNEPMPSLLKEGFKDVIEFLEEIYNIGQQRNDEEISTVELFVQTKELISSNLNYPLIKRVHDLEFNSSDTHLYLYLIWETLLGNKTNDIGRAVERIFDSSSKRVNYMQKVASGENILIKNNLIEIVESKFFNNTEMELSDYSLDILEECGLKLFSKKKKKDNIIQPSKIPTRKLIFNDNEMQQLTLLKNLLNGSNLSTTQDRLVSKNLPKGIAVLLHGAPGTGKTESVMQLAKKTEREIMKVEISQSKSMWFGESEKIIKRIFTDYKLFAKECEHVPILFFNEADAIFSKRMEIGSSNLAQTENAIQNIILEELENFEGILMATTNLTNNLDSAFERRFLFKIEFQKPDVSIKAKIWKLKLPALRISDCENLATSFDFSGGQIDNIVRKSEIYEILHGISLGFQNIFNFCKEETLVNNSIKIGYTKS